MKQHRKPFFILLALCVLLLTSCAAKVELSGQTVKDDIDLTFVTLIPQESMAFNIRDDYGKPVKVKFSHSGNGVVPDGYRVRITSWSNSYMQVDQVVTLHGNTAEVNPKYLMSKQEMADALRDGSLTKEDAEPSVIYNR